MILIIKHPGFNVNMPRSSKISQLIGVNESISYRLQISKHNRTQRGWQRQTRRHRRKPEFIYDNSGHQLRYRLRCFHRLNTTQQSNLLLSPQFQQYCLSLRKGLRRISNCQHSTKSTNWYWSTQLPLNIADILEPQAKNESKVGGFKPTNSSMDRYLQK